ncbi:putative efflux pump gsfJ [Fusarium oxysporum]|nr:putative efflux pump gsfJ [Fusarium oxysporum]RKL07279.1 putative efflux pump gsfJ [Fusarium oxysporum]
MNASSEKPQSELASSGPSSDGDEKQTGTPPAVDDGDYPTGFRLIAIVIALALGVFLVSLDMTIVATAIPKITDEFQSLTDVSWYSSAFFMTLGGFQSAWGKAYKYFPLKLSFMMAILIFEVGSLLCGVAPNSVALIVGRAIAGLGAAGLASGVYTLIAFSATPKKRPMFTGIIGTSYGFAAVVGPLVGGAFSENVLLHQSSNWRHICLGYSLLLYDSPSGKTTVCTTHRETPATGSLGIILAMGSVTSYILVLHYGGTTYAWNSSQVIGLLVGFVLLCIAFFTWEWYNGDRSMIPFRLLLQRTYFVESIYALFYQGAYFLVIYYLPIYFQSIDNVSPAMSGVRNLPLIVSSTLAMLSSGAFITITGLAAPIAVLGTSLSLICSGLLYTFEIGTSEAKWIGYQVIGGLGWGMAGQIPVMVVQANSSPADLPEATAILLFFQMIGGAFLVSAAESAFVNVLLRVLPHSAPGVDPAAVINAGATSIRQLSVSENLINGILEAYMRGLKISFVIGLASCCIAFVVIVPFQRYRRLEPASLANAGAM